MVTAPGAGEGSVAQMTTVSFPNSDMNCLQFPHGVTNWDGPSGFLFEKKGCTYATTAIALMDGRVGVAVMALA